MNDLKPPRWAGGMVATKRLRTTAAKREPPLFGTLSPDDGFEERLASFAEARRIDVAEPGGRLWALELAARGNPALARMKVGKGRPKKTINRLLAVAVSDGTLAAVEGLKAVIAKAAGVAPADVSDAAAIRELVSVRDRSRGLRSNPGSSGFLAEVRTLQKKVGDARKAESRPAKPGRRKYRKKIG